MYSNIYFIYNIWRKENIDLFDFELTKEDIEKIETLENKISLFGWYD